MADKINNTYFFRKSGGGGGGGATDAVQYVPQTLTEAQQMQARKNQDLYYTETVPEQLVAEWDGDTEAEGLIGFSLRTD